MLVVVEEQLKSKQEIFDILIEKSVLNIQTNEHVKILCFHLSLFPLRAPSRISLFVPFFVKLDEKEEEVVEEEVVLAMG